jgi:hypothetical protein
MRYEDLSPGAFLLHKGVGKLLDYGTNVFEMFADEVGLSFTDRNRIIAKCKLADAGKGFKETPCPKKLIGERWNYYTKYLCYSESKTRELLKFTDKSYENQFIPPSVDKLIGGIG